MTFYKTFAPSLIVTIITTIDLQKYTPSVLANAF